MNLAVLIFIERNRYYFDGGQHSPLGYSEQQYSLPRWIDLTVSRQGLLDDAWIKPVVLGWMFLPMKPYHAGGMRLLVRAQS